MLKSLISEPDPAPALPLDGLFETLSQTLPAEESLNGRIQRLAEGLVETTFITGALVVVVGNDGEALDLASAGFYGDPLGGTDFDDLNRLARDLSSLADWSHIATGRLIRNTTNPERGLLLLGRRLNSGLLFVSTNADFPRKELIHSLRGAEPFLSWILQDAIRVEASRLQSELRQAEIRILCKPNPISVQGIVEELRSVFRADEATLWIQEQNKLFLSATTDPSLAGRPAAYDSGQGLTGWIYKHGWSLRLRNALDPEEISEKTKGKTQRRPPIHPEGISTEGKPVRMLAVPLRAGKKIRGVIRLLKRGTRPPFSGHELSLLERTASLMAVAIHSSWQLYQANAILTAETEAICISTTAKRRGEHVPTITTADPGAVSLFGKSQQQLEGSIASDFYAAGEYERVRKFLLQARHQEQKKKQRKEDRVKQQIVAGPLQTRIRTKDGVRPAKISYRLLSSPFTQPSSKYTIAVIQPIQEVSAENHIANLLDKMNLAYFRTDIEGITVQTSKTEQKATGYTEAELLKLHRSKLYRNPQDRDPIIEAAKEKKGDLYHMVQRLRGKRGKEFLAEGVIRQISGYGGQPVGFEGLYEDVTDREKLQNFLGDDSKKIMKEKELYNRLHENARLHLMFMTSVSHQLRAPLGALIEHMKNFKDGITDRQAFLQRLNYATRQARVCSLLVSNFSYMDQILRGASFQLTSVKLISIAHDVKKYFEHLLLERELSLKIKDRTFGPLRTVQAHPELMVQVFVNLIDNAIKYSNIGSSIVIEGIDGGHRGRILQISNQGLLIPVDQRKKLFDRGTRLPLAKALVPGGTGLGLWLVKKILDTQKATITCTSIVQGKAERTAFQISFANSHSNRLLGRRE